MSAKLCDVEDCVPEEEDGGEKQVTPTKKKFTFEMKQSIPVYLVAMAVGDLVEAEVGPRSSIWTEPCMIETATKEFDGVLEEYLAIGERLFGEYLWERYDILVMPPSFPYGGMENPRLTFVSPCTIAGDKSLVSSTLLAVDGRSVPFVAHELSHSWFGNLVTNATWSDFFLNEGFTMYAERRITEESHGRPLSCLDAKLGEALLREEISSLGEKSPLTRLRVPLDEGIDPGDCYNQCAYEKGYAFVCYLRSLVGSNEVFDDFLKRYCAEYRFRSIPAESMIAFFLKSFPELANAAGTDLKGDISFNTWLNEPGFPHFTPNLSDAQEIMQNCESLAFHWRSSSTPVQPSVLYLSEEAKQWEAQPVLYFLDCCLETKFSDTDVVIALGDTLSLWDSHNSEILFRWALVLIRNSVVTPTTRYASLPPRRMQLRRACCTSWSATALSCYSEPWTSKAEVAAEIVLVTGVLQTTLVSHYTLKLHESIFRCRRLGKLGLWFLSTISNTKLIIADHTHFVQNYKIRTNVFFSACAYIATTVVVVQWQTIAAVSSSPLELVQGLGKTRSHYSRAGYSSNTVLRRLPHTKLLNIYLLIEGSISSFSCSLRLFFQSSSAAGVVAGTAVFVSSGCAVSIVIITLSGPPLAADGGSDSGKRALPAGSRGSAERDRESIGSSSGSDVELLAKSEELQQDTRRLKEEKEKEKAEAWACQMCTFVNEDASASKCELCESARPGPPRKTRKLSQWLSQPVERTEKKSKKKASSGAHTEPIEVIDSSDNGSDDDAASVASAASYSEAARAHRSNGKASGMAPTLASNKGLWADLYAPKTVDELCVNKKKVQEVSEWLERNASPSAGVFQKRLLFLCGPPGSGKSTAVRCIARKLGLLVKEWEDNSAAGKLNYERMLREDFWLPQVSGVDDFSDFIHRSSAYAALPMATSRHTSSIGRKRPLSSSQQISKSANVSSSDSGQLILVESWPQSWSKNPSQYEEKLQRIYQHVVDPVGGFRYPVVCIYSDVQGSKIDLDHLSRKFSREVIHSPLTSVININTVTSAQLKKNLTRVVAHENCASQPVDIQKVIDSSNGDMRHALNMLQLSQNPTQKKAKVTASKKVKMSSALTGTSESKSASSTARDPFLSDFHVVGKLLHGKLLLNKSVDEHEMKSGADEIDYDQIFDASAMPLDRALGLVHENSIAYFSQVEDLSSALELMSLCEVMVAESYNGVSNSEAFKRSRDVAQAILMRTVAVTNENPAPKAFRPITRPRTYAAKQRIVSRREEMLQATRGGELGLQYACTGDVFAFEVEPFLTLMDQAGGPTTQSNACSSTFAVDTLSIREEVDDAIEDSDGEW
ncbi:hypothetical protein ON010_g5531 [Phytophthora cinnamomi]|nr:hypothetical protein ON010_g5531 [Phytophthora cinnamomi]